MTPGPSPTIITTMKNKFAAIVVFSMSLVGAASIGSFNSKGRVMTFKAATKIPHTHSIHGDLRVDDYFWMRERDTPAVLDFLKTENQRTAEALHPVLNLERGLYDEMRARIKEDDSTVPAFDNGFYYYVRFQTGQEYGIHCRKPAAADGSLTADAKEEILLDENVEARGHTYFSVADVEVSPNHELLAFAVDKVGRRIHSLFFKDLKTGKMLPDVIEGITSNFVWAADNKTVFYSKQDPETLRSYQIFRYELGGKPELIFEEKDTTFNVWVQGTRRNQYIFMVVAKRDSSEWRMLDSTNPRGEWQILQPREPMHEYSVADAGDRLLFLTNWQATNFRLMEAPYDARGKAQWREVIPTSSTVYLEDVDAYAGHFVIGERENGLSQVRIRDRQSGQDRLLKFPDPTYEVSAMGLPDFNSKYLRFSYQSLVQPPSVYDEDFVSKERVVRKVREVPGYNPNLYESKRIWAEGKDGVRIPMSVLMKKGLSLSGENPVLLYGYGSYGLSTEAYFRSSVMSLVDRGFVFAIGHIRGGSEMGRDWYEKGRLKYKMNTFHDFIACAEKLISEKITSSEHLHIMGGSAGGLLVGAVINMRPELFKGAVAAVPFVDVLTTMLDESIPLTTGEYNEWGDPRIKEQYMHMREYSPYDNVRATAYPNILVTTGYHDSQVQYWEPAKWVARLREMKTDSNHLLFYTELNAGHSGASGRFEALKTLAKEYAFFLMLEGKGR